jgi:hypothetical protein
MGNDTLCEHMYVLCARNEHARIKCACVRSLIFKAHLLMCAFDEPRVLWLNLIDRSRDQ